MKNMQMDNMNMDNSSTNHHTSMGHMTMMKNYFHFSAEAVVLFFGWRTETWPDMLGSFIGIALIAILYESMKVLREFIDARYQRQTSVDNDHKLSVNDATTPASRKSDKTHCCKWGNGVLNPWHWLQTLLHFIQMWLSLSLMLVFMTFNVYLCLAVTVGGAIGYFCFAWILRPGQHRYATDDCH